MGKDNRDLQDRIKVQNKVISEQIKTLDEYRCEIKELQKENERLKRFEGLKIGELKTALNCAKRLSSGNITHHKQYLVNMFEIILNANQQNK